MTEPCWRCGAARSCAHREVEPPRPIPDRVSTDNASHAQRKPRDYSGNGFNFGTRKRKYYRDRA